MGKNVTAENRCLPCLPGPSATYSVELQLEPVFAEQAVLSPPLAVISMPRPAQGESEIIQNLNSEYSNQNVTGLEEGMNNLAPEKLTFRKDQTCTFQEEGTA